MVRTWGGRTSGPPDFYHLFGESRVNVEPVYKHLFFARGWSIETPEFVSPDARKLKLKGTGLRYQNGVRAVK
jgi:hypothetical protein